MRSVARVILIYSLGTLSGCARPSLSSPPPELSGDPHRCGGYRGGDRCGDPDGIGGPADPLAVVLRVAKGTPTGGERVLREGEQLHSGERLALHLRTNRPAHLAVVLRSPSGAVEVVFRSRTPAGCALRLPQRGWLKLDELVGDEQVQVVATLQPLAQLDRGACAAQKLPCDELTAPAPEAQLACASGPAPADPIEDGLRRLRIGRDEGQGLAVTDLSFQHVR